MKKILLQGYPGSYHDVACQAYFRESGNEVVACDSFEILAKTLAEDDSVTHAVMAIENSIAGSILQNYRLLRENNFNIIGEIYLRIEHCLMALPGTQISDLTEIHSHPMAIKQCRTYFNNYPHLALVDKEDTALSAKMLQERGESHVGAIASKRAAEIYHLDVLQENVEDNKHNYTRFFIIQKEKVVSDNYNKASVCLQLKHTKGSLSMVLNELVAHDINLSKLQSYPVLGQLTQYFFHMDLEFYDPKKYLECKVSIDSLCINYQELGKYQKADLSAALRNELTSVAL